MTSDNKKKHIKKNKKKTRNTYCDKKKYSQHNKISVMEKKKVNK